MIMGHYGVSFLCHGLNRNVPLWVLFIAVQFVDIFWCIFNFLGWEKFRIDFDLAGAVPLDLYYMPFSHSLTAVVAWAVLGAALYLWYRKAPVRNQMGIIVAAAVISHWLVDIIVHRHDLPLYDNAMKVGFSLWTYTVPSFLVESFLIAGGVWFAVYQYKLHGRSFSKPMWAFITALIIANGVFYFGPFPASKNVIIFGLLALYFGLAYCVYRLETAMNA